tara:strand:+ start:520 stop:1908 length:1389 start_codon:yes stop_codon:yes gene_type:complete
MSNILTDILGLDARGQYKGDPLSAKDVFVIGDVHQPRMLGISSPIPIRDEKLVTFYDLALSVIGLLRIENTTGSPPPSVTPGAQLVIGPDQTGNPFLWKVRTLTSTDNTVAFSYTGADSELVDLSMTLSTDVHVDTFTYDIPTHLLTIRLNSGTTFNVDLTSLSLDIFDDSVPVDTNVTQISFDGPGVAASVDGTGITVVEIPQGQIDIQEEGASLTPTGVNGLTFINFIGDGVTAAVSGTADGTIDVTVSAQEEVFLLMASSCEFTPNRTDGTYDTVAPVNPVYRFGGGAGIFKLFKPDFHNWNDADADVTVGSNPQSFQAKEDQITQAIPIPVDLLATDKINVSGTCYIKQNLSLDGQAKIKVAVGQGECADDLSFNVLNAASIDTFAGVAENPDGNERHSYYQRICFDFDTLIGGDGAQAGDDHFFIGFSFEGLNLPASGDYTQLMSVNWNMSAIKNPS